MSSSPKIHRGLKGVYFERSAVSQIDGRKGELSYRGYSIHDLAENSCFEEVAHLLIYGELPTQSELDRFKVALNSTKLPDGVIDIIDTLKTGHPMDVLRTGVSALSSLDESTGGTSVNGFIDSGIRLCGQIPQIVAAHEALRNGRTPVAPDPELGFAENWLYMLKGVRPTAKAARLTDIDFVLHAEHGPNASSFAARVTVGTQADLHASIVTAISTLAGPAHGGAAEDVMHMVREIGEAERAAEYVKDKRKRREAVTGFGHRVYRVEDPRAKHMRAKVAELSRELNEPEWFDILQAVVKAMQPYSRFGLNVNVDFYSGVLHQLNKIPMDLFVPIFAVGRVPGWVAQCLEQLHSNILIRPLTLYNGPDAREYNPIGKR